MDPENITPNGLDGGSAPSVNAPASPNGAVGSVPASAPASTAPATNAAGDLSLTELNTMLGKNFPTKEAALKSIQDTYSFVGKRKEDLKPEVDPSQFISRDQYETDMFYSKNAEYEAPEVRSMIDAMAKAQNLKPADVVKTEGFKTIFDKIAGYDKSMSEKSVLETNPRLASSKDSLTKAAEHLGAGNREAGEALVAKAVLESMK